MQNFKNLKIWQQGIEIVVKAYKLSKQLSSEEKYGLVSQLTRAVVSIPSNIAEGSSRVSEKEFNYYLQIALGSAYEVETLLITIEKIDLVRDKAIKELKEMIVEEQRMINGLMKRKR